LSDEKDRDILKKSIHYKVGKTIMSSIGDSPLKYGNYPTGKYQKTEGDESAKGSRIRSKSIGNRDQVIKPSTLDLP